MDFNYIEELVYKCKNRDMLSKDKLAEEFRPLIFNFISLNYKSYQA